VLRYSQQLLKYKKWRNVMKKNVFLLLFALAPGLYHTPHARGNSGGAVAGGVLGGFALGSIVGASAGRRHERRKYTQPAPLPPIIVQYNDARSGRLIQPYQVARYMRSRDIQVTHFDTRTNRIIGQCTLRHPRHIDTYVDAVTGEAIPEEALYLYDIDN
jgi:hypothetical protein